MLKDANRLDVSREVGQMLVARKALKRKLKHKYEREVKEEMLAEHKKNMKFAKAGAAPKRDILHAQKVDSRSIVEAADKAIENEINSLVVTEDGEGGEDCEIDDIDMEALNEGDDERDNENDNNEQEIWSDLPEEITLEVRRDDDDGITATEGGRMAFLRRWVGFRSGPSSGLNCLQCQLDDTVPIDRKNKQYTFYKLESRMKTDYHQRIEALTRAFLIDTQEPPSVPCPICSAVLKSSHNKDNFRKHVRDNHPEQLGN